MKVVLAEKPSVARDLAKALGATTRRNGYLEGRGWAVTWALGHLVELKEPHEYDPAWKAWRADVLPMVPPKFGLRPRGDKGAKDQLKTVAKLLRQAEEIVCATDAGREGELIFRYIVQYARCASKPVRRLWISSLTPAAIEAGFAKLRPGSDFDPLYQAARCRSEADWIVGLNGTRFYTVSSGEGRQLWSVGRVQTPVLALIVARDLEIERFVPEDYWEVHTVYRDTRFKHRRGRFKTEAEAVEMVDAVRPHDLEIKDIQEKRERVLPPLLFDLTNLQKEMNKRHGLSADATLKAAQNLYEQKHITYPRTDSRYLTADMRPRIAPLLQRLADLYPKQVESLDLADPPVSKRIVNDAKVDDHHAIIPTELLPRSLTGNEAKVYNAVALRFIAAFHPTAIKAVTTVEAAANEQPFRARGTVIVEPGWMRLYPFMLTRRKGGEDQVMPAFKVGERGPHAPETKACKTKPPKRFNDHSLLAIMESAGRTVDEEELKAALKEKGLGTPATRAAIIETLIARGYVQREKKNLVSTGLGRRLIGMVGDERLKSAELTGDWEGRLKQIEKGRGDPESFMRDVVSYTEEIVRNGLRRDGPIGDCPRCRAEVIEGQRGYGCSRWKEGCDFVLWKTQFGAVVPPALAREILANGRTLVPLKLEEEGGETSDETQSFTGHIVIRDGQVCREKIEIEEIEGSLGECPLCGSPVSETKKSYGCSRWREGCGFAIWKTIAGKRISAAMARTLLSKGETAVLKGFTSKAGKTFSAALKLGADGRATFVFPDRN